MSEYEENRKKWRAEDSRKKKYEDHLKERLIKRHNIHIVACCGVCSHYHRDLQRGNGRCEAIGKKDVDLFVDVAEYMLCDQYEVATHFYSETDEEKQTITKDSLEVGS